MDPNLVEGDILVWIPTKIKDIKIGDIVIFKSYNKWPDEKLIAHRVTDIHVDKSTGDLILETKGDANEWKDQENPSNRIPYIQKDNIQGKVICFGNQPFKININFIVFLLIIFIVLLSSIYLYRSIKSKYTTFLYWNRSECNSNR